VYIYEYDSQKRANTGSTKDNWKRFDGQTLERGKGYRILSYVRDVEFPAKAYPTGGSNALFAYNDKEVLGLKDYINDVPNLVQYYPNGRGWNYLGGVNTSAFDVKQSFNVIVDGQASWNQAIYYMDTDEEYQSLLLKPGMDDNAIASPYAPFFVQVRGEDNTGSAEITAHFYKAGVTVSDAVPSDFRASETANDDVIWSLDLQSGDASDHVYLVFGDQYKDGYRIQEDAFKMLSSAKPQVWAEVESIQLFANALPRDDGKEVKLGFSVPATGQYTFAFVHKVGDSQFVKKAILEDKVTGTQTDVLAQTYSFAANEPSKQITDRFVLHVNRSVTGVSAVESPSIYAYVQEALLTVKNVANGDKIQIVDLSGRVVASGIAQSNEFSTPLNQKGVFIVNVKGEKNAVLKVLSK